LYRAAELERQQTGATAVAAINSAAKSEAYGADRVAGGLIQVTLSNRPIFPKPQGTAPTAPLPIGQVFLSGPGAQRAAEVLTNDGRKAPFRTPTTRSGQ